MIEKMKTKEIKVYLSDDGIEYADEYYALFGDLCYFMTKNYTGIKNTYYHDGNDYYIVQSREDYDKILSYFNHNPVDPKILSFVYNSTVFPALFVVTDGAFKEVLNSDILHYKKIIEMYDKTCIEEIDDQKYKSKV